MKVHPRLFAALLSALLLVPLARAEEAKSAPPAGVRVFSAGHSFHMPIVNPLAEMAKAAGIDHKIAGSQSIGGSTVTKHWELPDDKNKAKKALLAGEVDVLTLSPYISIPDPAIDKFTALLLEHNPAGRVLLQASWMPRDGSIMLSFKNAARDATQPDMLRGMFKSYDQKLHEQATAINALYAEKAKRQIAFIVPVNEAVTILREKVVKGEVPGISRQSELFRDDLGHGKEAIYLLNAYCHYAVIYGKSPVGLPTPTAFQKANLGDNTDKVNKLLQEIAWQAVIAEPMSGVKK
ncbi:hypothetical protein [Humisphaera borealis]|uniref:ABC transporter substrate-binding protein n=1 Tax=Humisphaera borealis TaxID=2807512 RepID=A0A7M2WVU5_9BACT|nr:hypothetical protein [Humisphaera borealis]QOV89648.1 hypothetical protein IPV69_26250 [Humisphaera borealis]